MLRQRTVPFVCLVFLALGLGCGCTSEKPAGPPPADAHVRALADNYLAAWFSQFPELVTLFGVPGHPQDKLTDNSLEALKAWQDREDAMARRSKADRPSNDRRAAVAGHLRDRPRSARRTDRAARVPQRTVDRQPVRERMASAGRLPGDDSAGRHRGSTQGGAGPLGRAAEIHRHGNHQPSPRDQSTAIPRPKATSAS